MLRGKQEGGAQWGAEAPLLEREQELAAIGRLLESTRLGRGGIGVIDGDAGLGKSRLLSAARATAEAAGMRVLTAHGSELEQDFAFGITRQLFGVAVDGREILAAILDLHERLMQIAAQAPILVAVDDAQWADEPALRFLAHLALRIEDLPIALLVAVRAGERSDSEALIQRLRESPNALGLMPLPLSEAAVAQMVNAAFGANTSEELTAACSRATGGNPFYLTELLQALASDSGAARPERVQAVAPPAVLRSTVVRLARLGEDAASLARAVAVLGDEVPLSRAAALAGVSDARAEAAADLLAGAGIFERGAPLRFLHPLIATALEADMGAFEWARAHHRAAGLLLDEGAPTERVSAHLMIAQPQGDPRAVAALEDAAARAIANGMPAVATRLLERALAEPPNPVDEPGVLLASAKAQLLAGREDVSPRLEAALERIELGEERAGVLIELATLAHLRWDFEGALELARRARTELSAGDPRQEELLGIELAAAALSPSLGAELEERLTEVVDRARTGHPPSDGRLLAVVIARLAIADPPELVRGLANAAIARDPLIDGSHGASLGWIAAALEWVDELELGERWLDQAVATAKRRGAVLVGSIAKGNRARFRYFRGRLLDAEADGVEALEIYRYGWSNSPWSAPVLAMSRVALGRFDAAREALSTGRASGDAPDLSRLLEAEAHLQLVAGEPAAALESACRVGDVVEGRFGAIQPRVWEWRRLAALAAHRLGDGERARELLEPDLAELRRVGPGRQLGHALTVAGLVTGGTEGVELLSEAAQVLEGSPARLQRSETLVHLGAALRRSGKRQAAKETLGAALELAAEMRAEPIEREARAELGRLGLRPRRTAQSGVAALTPSERQIAELAADGLTTPQIAQQLFISRNTVETHLRHVYRKLSVSGRRGLPDALAEAVEAR